MRLDDVLTMVIPRPRPAAAVLETSHRQSLSKMCARFAIGGELEKVANLIILPLVQHVLSLPGD